jgi:mxaJ protein
LLIIFMAAHRRILAAVLLASVFASAFAQEDERKSFRVCQDPNNLPFANTKGEGIENKLAELFAKELKLPVEYFSFPQRMGFLRNTLRFKLPGENFRCDVVMGWPPNDGAVLATKPYYRSTYALVFPKDGKLKGVDSGEAFLALPKEKLGQLKIGVLDRSPASQWLAKHNLVDQGVPFRMLNADPEHYAGKIIDESLAKGDIDVAVVWGPIGGYFAKKVKKPEMVVVPLKSEPGVRFDYEIAMAVRQQDKKLKEALDQLLEKNRPQILAILKDFGVPVVDDKGAPVQ